MKKLFLTLAVCIFAATCMSAQQPTFMKGDNVVNVGIGLGGNLYGWYSGGGISKLPVLSASFEHCIIDNLFDEKSSLGVGGLLAYTQAKYNDSGWGWKTSNIVIGARGALHYALVDKLDTYVGMMLGYNIYSFKYTGTGYYDNYGHGNSGLAFSIFAGARYYFTDAIAAFAELGYGYAILNLGVSFKF
jgi:hypothetical protein